MTNTQVVVTVSSLVPEHGCHVLTCQVSGDCCIHGTVGQAPALLLDSEACGAQVLQRQSLQSTQLLEGPHSMSTQAYYNPLIQIVCLCLCWLAALTRCA
jgi:hypothetical protein